MSGINFIELGWRNFLSYGNNLTSISLNFTKPTVISGKNLDSSVEGQIDSNGAGKSTILNVLSYALYDKTISDIKKDNLINWINEKNMEVYVIFEKNKTYYKVERFRKFLKKGGDGIRILTAKTNDFSENNYKDETKDSIANANEQLVNILGVPFDIFSRVVLFSSATESFFSLPTTSATNKTSQRDIIEELFGYTEISLKSEILKKNISNNKSDFGKLLELNKQIIAEEERLCSQIEFTESESQKWLIDAKKEKEILLSEIKTQSQIDYEEEKIIINQIKKIDVKIDEHLNMLKEKELLINSHNKIINLNKSWELKHIEEINLLEEKFKSLGEINFEEELKIFDELEKATSHKNEIESTIFMYDKKINDLNSTIKNNENELSHLNENKCPYCLQEYKEVKHKILNLKKNITQCELEKEELFLLIKTHQETVTSKISEISSFKSKTSFESPIHLMNKKLEYSSLDEKIKSLVALTNPHIITTPPTNEMEILSLENEIGILKSKSTTLKSIQKVKSEQDLYNLQALLESNKKLLKSIDNKENPYTASLSKLKSTKLSKNKNEELEELKDQIEHQEFLFKLLTKKDSYIRKALLSKNLPFLNSRLKHHLNKTGLPHKVIFTEEMNAVITQFGTKIEYQNLSTGQKARLNLAISFAFRDILQTRHEKINLCMLDEYLDSGLSQVGVSMAIKMLKDIAREDKIPMFIISHRDEVASMFDSKIEVEMNNKFSNIVKADIKFSCIE